MRKVKEKRILNIAKACKGLRGVVGIIIKWTGNNKVNHIA